MTFRHLWFDPGQTTGWALFEDERPTHMGTLEYPTELFDALLYDLLEGEEDPLDLIGYENYRLRPKGHERGWTPDWSEVIPIRVIGAIELAGFRYNRDQVFRTQEPDVKPAGYGYAGLGKYDPNKRGMHMQDAIAHGAFYFMEEHCAVRRTNAAQGERLRRAGRPHMARPYRGPRKT